MVNIISGEVSTNILKRDRGRTLPENSVYRPLEKQFANHVGRTPRECQFDSYLDMRLLTDYEETTSPEEYACSVIAEVTKSRPGAWFWTGARSSEVRYCDLLLPRTFWVREWP